MTTKAQQRPETAGETPAAADVQSEGDRGTAAQHALAAMVRETIEETVGPTLDAWARIRDFVDECDNDAELGRRVRKVVQQWAIDREPES